MHFLFRRCTGSIGCDQDFVFNSFLCQILLTTKISSKKNERKLRFGSLSRNSDRGIYSISIREMGVSVDILNPIESKNWVTLFGKMLRVIERNMISEVLFSRIFDSYRMMFRCNTHCNSEPMRIVNIWTEYFSEKMCISVS